MHGTQAYCSQFVADSLIKIGTAGDRCADAGEEDEVLTPRQVEILTLVASGMTYRKVGETLHLSERTIRYHMGKIIERLHLENRTQVIAYAVRTGLVRGTLTEPNA